MPPIELLNELFILDAENGHLIRKREWTNHKAGEICGTKMKAGHLMTSVNQKRYLVHRIIYFMATGIDPLENVVDHANGIPDDNRIENLRLASKKQNSQHKTKLSVKNTSGHRNVCWSNKWNCWLVSIKTQNKCIQRHFQDLTKAAECAAMLRKQHYGEFSGLTV